MKLSEDQKQSLITSLLGYVRRISFHGTQSEEEAKAFFLIVNLLLGYPVALKLDMDKLAGVMEEGAESEESQESENSGYCNFCECCCSRCFAGTD